MYRIHLVFYCTYYIPYILLYRIRLVLTVQIIPCILLYILYLAYCCTHYTLYLTVHIIPCILLYRLYLVYYCTYYTWYIAVVVGQCPPFCSYCGSSSICLSPGFSMATFASAFACWPCFLRVWCFSPPFPKAVLPFRLGDEILTFSLGCFCSFVKQDSFLWLFNR